MPDGPLIGGDDVLTAWFEAMERAEAKREVTRTVVLIDPVASAMAKLCASLIELGAQGADDEEKRNATLDATGALLDFLEMDRKGTLRP